MHRTYFYHFETKSWPLYWLMFGYIVLGWLWPIVGWALLFYIIGTIITAFWRGRWWCGHVCPRGNFYLHLLSKYSPHHKIPPFARSFWFRLFVLLLVFSSFGLRMYHVWGDWSAMGGVFWLLFVTTTVIGIVLSFVYAPMMWCSFCPIGTLAAWAAPKKMPLPMSFPSVKVGEKCEGRCKTCARVCPMQLRPYESKCTVEGYLNPDCFKCRKCVKACPSRAIVYL